MNGAMCPRRGSPGKHCAAGSPGGTLTAMRPLAMIAAGLCVAVRAPAQTPARVEVIDSAFLAAPRLVESSGVTTSALVPGVYWTHNDSGDGPYLYATDSTGRDLGAVRVAGAHAVDWEELAAGPCVIAPGPCLYAADIGDNRRRRAHVVLYRLREPAPPTGPADTLGSVPLLDSLVLAYPDRPHDAEALVVTPGGTILLVTKDLIGPARLFRASASGGPETRTLAEVGVLDLETGLVTGRLATGAALSPDGRVLVVRTYVSLHFFRVRGDSLPAPLSSRRGITIPVIEPQGEGVSFDGPDRLVLTSEQGNSARGTIVRLRILPR
jgi:hypothetical protein